jgi:uncharacterized protein (UPF0335 family)
MAKVGGIDSDSLKQIIDRIERLEEEKKSIADDIKEVYGQAKSQGYDAKIIREIIKIRKTDDETLQEIEFLIDTYKRALGMVPELDEESKQSSDAA